MAKTPTKPKRSADPKTVRYRVDQKDHRFVKVPLHLLERGRFLTPKAKWLYVTLRSFKNENHGMTFPGYKKIMERSGLSRNAVAEGLAELERWGWITRKKKVGRSTRYEFFYPALVVDATNEEIGDQTFPTKELAMTWRKETRGKKRNQF